MSASNIVHPHSSERILDTVLFPVDIPPVNPTKNMLFRNLTPLLDLPALNQSQGCHKFEPINNIKNVSIFNEFSFQIIIGEFITFSCFFHNKTINRNRKIFSQLICFILVDSISDVLRKIQVIVQFKMSAPMSSLELIPNQHIRQELCVTRPAYRDGRDPKAVKVNN